MKLGYYRFKDDPHLDHTSFGKLARYFYWMIPEKLWRINEFSIIELETLRYDPHMAMEVNLLIFICRNCLVQILEENPFQFLLLFIENITKPMHLMLNG